MECLIDIIPSLTTMQRKYTMPQHPILFILFLIMAPTLVKTLYQATVKPNKPFKESLKELLKPPFIKGAPHEALAGTVQGFRPRPRWWPLGGHGAAVGRARQSIAGSSLLGSRVFVDTFRTFDGFRSDFLMFFRKF